MSRVTVTKIEKGTERAENASISDVLALAAALDVAPVHLLTPREDELTLAITPKLKVEAPTARSWIRGAGLLPGGDPAAFFAQMPLEEQRLLMRTYLERGLDPIGRALMAEKIEGLVTDERIEDIVWEATEGERIRRQEQPKEEENNHG